MQYDIMEAVGFVLLVIFHGSLTWKGCDIHFVVESFLFHSEMARGRKRKGDKYNIYAYNDAKIRKYHVSGNSQGSVELEVDDLSESTSPKSSWRESCDYGISYERLPRDLYDAADIGNTLRPSYLRPTEERQQLLTNYMVSLNEDSSIIGNRLVNMDQLGQLFTKATHDHSAHSADCVGDFFFPQSQEQPQGICTQVVLACRLCGFKSQKTKLFKEQEHTGPGRKAAIPNIQLANFLSKDAISYDSVMMLFSSIESVSLSATGIQKHVNKAGSVWLSVNEKQIQENRNDLKKVLHHRCGPNQNGVYEASAEIDTSYSNPPKGRSMSQPATQCITPLLENDTKKKMVIGISTESQLCGLGPRCNRDHSGCGATMSHLQSLSSAENKAAVDLYNENLSEGLALSALTHDGLKGSCHAKGMKKAAQAVGYEPPESQFCRVHLSRGVRRKGYNIVLSEQANLTDNNQKNKKITASLVTALDKRLTAELCKGCRFFGNNKERFVKFMESVRVNVLFCVSGVHTKCRKSSLVCSGKPAAGVYSGLPNNQRVNLTESDRVTLQELVDYKLAPDRVLAQRMLRHTNRVESFHLRTLKVVPKSKTYARNYKSRVHSAAHNASVGVSNSLLAFNEATGSSLSKGSRAINKLSQIMDRKLYISKRQNSPEFVVRRKQLHQRQLKLRQLQKLSIQDTNISREVHQEHMYSEQSSMN